MKRFFDTEKDELACLRGRLIEGVIGLLIGDDVEDVDRLANKHDGRLRLLVDYDGNDWLLLNGRVDDNGKGVEIDDYYMIGTRMDCFSPEVIDCRKIAMVSFGIELEEVELAILKNDMFGEDDRKGSFDEEISWFKGRYCEIKEIVAELGIIASESPIEYAQRIGNRESVNLLHLMDIMDEMRDAINGLWEQRLWADKTESGRIERFICRLIGNLRCRLGGR